MGIRENIVLLRKHFKVTQEELASVAGVTRGAVSQWEGGFSEPRMGAIQKIADHFGISKSNIIEDDGMRSIDPKTGKVLPVAVGKSATIRRAPIVGRIAAGDPREAIQQADSWQYIFNPSASDDSFYLVCAGDSMNKVIPQGMLVLIDPDKEVNSGDVAAVMVNGDDATLKRVYFAGNTIVLHPESTNPAHHDRTIDSTNPEAPEFRVIGPVIGLCTAPEWRP